MYGGSKYGLILALVAGAICSPHPSALQLRSAESYAKPYTTNSRGKGGKTPRTFSGVAKASRAAKQARRAH